MSKEVGEGREGLGGQGGKASLVHLRVSRSGRQPTPLWPGTCFQEGLPWNTLEESGDSSVHHRQKTQPRSHPRRAEIWARGFSTQAKELMGLLEAVKRGVSWSAELAGSRPNWKKTGGGSWETRLLSLPPPPRTFTCSSLGTKILGIQLKEAQQTPSQV